MEELLFERDELIQDDGVIAGCDEAGRGPLAGPVTAACVVLPDDFPMEILHDSKKMSEKDRDAVALIIKEKATAWAITSLSHEVIDEMNILQASLRAMKESFLEVRKKVHVDTLLIDGNKTPAGIDIPCRAVVKGDDRIHEIMAASILAKTERDRLMYEYDLKYPQYDYKKHKGYPTKEHIALIEKYGPSPIQRKSFHLKKDKPKEKDGSLF